jgi:hypothetical protein
MTDAEWLDDDDMKFMLRAGLLQEKVSERKLRLFAVACYQERELPSGHLDVTRLAVLADALEDAGCDNGDILQHCRGDGPHVRGCWVVDLLLGKE